MLNKEEVLYNVNSLVSVWFNDLKGIKELYIEMCGDNINKTYPCTIDDCCDIIAGLLCDKHDDYRVLKLHGNIGGTKKVIGEIDLV